MPGTTAASHHWTSASRGKHFGEYHLQKSIEKHGLAGHCIEYMALLPLEYPVCLLFLITVGMLVPINNLLYCSFL